MPQKKISILLVEDEENLQEALKLNLELEGYEVTSAYDGIEALKAVQQEYFDLMILDVMLPLRDGYSVCRELRSRKFNAPGPPSCPKLEHSADITVPAKGI